MQETKQLFKITYSLKEKHKGTGDLDEIFNGLGNLLKKLY